MLESIVGRANFSVAKMPSEVQSGSGNGVSWILEKPASEQPAFVDKFPMAGARADALQNCKRVSPGPL